ncbi:MAG: choice-of-anchor D domain-containing protein [Verrucomicrobiaceae bacterium]
MKKLPKAALALLEALLLPLLVFAYSACGPSSPTATGSVEILTPVSGAKITSLAGISGSFALTSGAVTSVRFELLRDKDGHEWNGSAWVPYVASDNLPASFNPTAKTWQASGALPAGSNVTTGLVEGNYAIHAVMEISGSELVTADSYFNVGATPPPVIPVAYGWGFNGNGEVGAGPGPNVNVPTKVTTSGVLDGKVVIDVAAGAEHSMALTTDGKVYCWGYNGVGALGDGTFTSSDVPVAVDTSGALAGKRVVAIGASDYQGYAMTEDHLVFAWGRNVKGELGIGITGGYYPSPMPVVMSGALSGKIVTDVTGGEFYSLARTSDGGIYAWGDNTDGQLGTGNNTASNVPVAVAGMSGKLVAAVEAGVFHAVVLTTLGEVYAFGSGLNGRLGNGSAASSNLPVQVGTTGAMSGKAIIQISATRHHTLALSSEGKVYAWGANDAIGLGEGGVLTEALTPLEVGGSLTGKTVTRVGTGWGSSYAFTTGNEMFAWGINYDGNLAGAVGMGIAASTPMLCNTSGVLTDSHSLLTMGGGWRHAVMLTAPRTTYQPDIAVETQAADVVNNGLVNMGSNAIGGTNEVSFIIRNRGKTTLTNLSLSVTGAAFSAGPLTQTSIAPNGSLVLKVTFQPAVLATNSGQITLTSNDPDEGSFQIHLNGTGLPLGDLAAVFGTQSITGTYSGTAVQADGKVLVCGDFSNIGGFARDGIARFNTDGTLDAAFDPAAFGGVNCVAVLRDGKILIGGDFFQVGTHVRLRLARLNSDGSLDTSFELNADGTVNCFLVQSDDKILVGGAFTNLGASSPDRLARLLPDGTVDTTFNPVIQNGAVRCVTRQSAEFSDLILIGGSFFSVSGQIRARIARLEANGLLDPALTADANNGFVNALTMLPDGRILAAGEFDGINGVPRNRLACFSQTGVVDASYDPNVSGIIQSMALQADGAVIIGGSISSVSGTSRSGTARIRLNGTLDPDFDPVVNGGGGVVSSAALQADGKILLAGSFTTVDGIPRNGLARLSSANAVQRVEANDPNIPDQVLWILTGGSPQTMETTLEKSTNGGTSWTFIGRGARLTTPQPGWQWFSVGSLPVNGLLRLRAVTQGGGGNGSSSLLEHVFTYNGPPVLKVDYALATNLPSFSTVEYDPVRAGSAASYVFTLSDIGGSSMTGLADGMLTGTNSGEFEVSYRPLVSTLAPGGTLELVIHYKPRSTGPHEATFTLPTNAPGATNYQIYLRGYGAEPIGTFREQNFGQSENAGASADIADPDGDALNNLVEYALGLDPTLANGSAIGTLSGGGSPPPPAELSDGPSPPPAVLTFDYSRNRLALADVEYQVEWSDTLDSGDWHTTSVTEAVVSETAETQQMRATLPAGSAGHRFVRLRLTRKP